MLRCATVDCGAIRFASDVMSKPNTFENLARVLVAAIPTAIASLKLAKAVCCVRIHYYDTHAPSTYLLLKTISADCRTSVLESKGRNALYYLWGSGEECGDGHVYLPKPTSPDDPPGIKTLLETVYDLLRDDEGKYMDQFRSMLQRVSLELHSIDWNRFCPVTDDFSIVPADGSAHFGNEYDDIANSIPPARLDLLRSRGLLGHHENWDRRPGDSVADEVKP
jgi:hypothetical protein